MKQIKVMVSVVVITLDDQGRPLGQDQGFKVGNQLVLTEEEIKALPGLIDRSAQEMIVECLPSAYMESATRWGDDETFEVKSA